MSKTYTQEELLRELEPVVEANLNRHLTVAKEWIPHDYIPWSDGRNFDGLDGRRGLGARASPTMSDVARSALIVNLLTEDNLPSYHHEIAIIFGRDGAWGEWVHRWTAEEGRHGIAMRDYLLVTRAVDPVAARAVPDGAHVRRATSPRTAPTCVRSLAYVSFQELATRVSHRNTGRFTDDPMADQLLARIAADENLHMIFYRNLLSAALRDRARTRRCARSPTWSTTSRCPAPASPASSARRSRWPSPASTTSASTATTSSRRCCGSGRSSSSRASSAEGEQARTELAELHGRASRSRRCASRTSATCSRPGWRRADAGRRDPGRERAGGAVGRMGRMSTPSGPPQPRPDGDPEQQRFVVVTQDGMGVSEREGEEDGATSPADLVEQPAKVMRIGSMIKQLLEEVRNAPLDEAGPRPPGRDPPPLDRRARGGPRARAGRGAGADHPALPGRRALATPSCGSPRPSSSGWLEGLFHGIQTALVAQQMAAQAQLQQMRALPAGHPAHPDHAGHPGPPRPQPRPPGVLRRGRADRPVPLTGRRPVASDDRRAAGHGDDLGGDVARLLRGQEDVGRGELGRLRRPPQRRLLAELGRPSPRASSRGSAGSRPGRARRVDPDALLGQLGAPGPW